MAIKIWNGHNYSYKEPKIVMVAAHSQKRAVQMLAEIGRPTSLYDFRNSWTGPGANSTDLEVSDGREGVWLRPDHHRHDPEQYERIWPKEAP